VCFGDLLCGGEVSACFNGFQCDGADINMFRWIKERFSMCDAGI
jgi:hypothetical protein